MCVVCGMSACTFFVIGRDVTHAHSGPGLSARALVKGQYLTSIYLKNGNAQDSTPKPRHESVLTHEFELRSAA